MKKLIMLVLIGLAFACAPDKPKEKEDFGDAESTAGKNAVEEAMTDPTKGLGAVTSVTLKTPLEQTRVERGIAIYEMKCSACHKLTDQRIVGPGWQGITKRRKPEWIMNMVTNTDIMLDKDPEAQKLLELCLVRMPNQNISVGDARDILEYMRKNDGEK
ncbi:MAG TPA: c-type cytochrome [Cyclobacteriaceae bacterium]